ncbi:MAG: MBL fold metallo-hydrolase [Bacteroidetes bacterium]|nr:MBL fold metallo-hydrolase [Bacteroidota bacterium]
MNILLKALLVIFLLIGGIFIFIKVAPQFGQPPEEQHLAKIKQSPHYEDGSFVNSIPTSMDMSFADGIETIREFLTVENAEPDQPLPVAFSNKPGPVSDSSLFITWFGHSAVLVEMEGKRILLDPMLGPSASPVSFIGQRFEYRQPIDFSLLQNIDFVVLSHDHYDHLDYPSIQKLNPEVGHFYVPLGVGSHLRRWGVDSSKITELDWWESAEAGTMSLTATPARHFSGRGLTDRNATLWASWVLKSPAHAVYFSGDSGYGPHFKEIGERFGPFDLAMMECGQYNKKWEAIHMLPEQTMQAFLDLKGKVLMPIHWGAFQLSVHPWTESVERLNRANTTGVKIATPVIGARLAIPLSQPTGPWYRFNAVSIRHSTFR